MIHFLDYSLVEMRDYLLTNATERTFGGIRQQIVTHFHQTIVQKMNHNIPSVNILFWAISWDISLWTCLVTTLGTETSTASVSANFAISSNQM